MLKKHEQLRINDLFKNGYSVKEVASLTGKTISTVYKYKKFEGQLQDGNYHRRDTHVSAQLVPFQELLDKHIKQRKLKPNEIYVILQQNGYKGNYHTFISYYRLRKQHFLPPKELQHIETGPGEQAQVDWAHFGEILVNGKKEKVYLFSYVLSYSRAIYLEYVVRQNQKTLQTCHLHAFEKLGIPKTIYYDNMKTVVNHREKLADGSYHIIYTLKFLNFAKYYGFEPIACHAYWPKEKGKVEKGFSYVRNHHVRFTPKMNVTLDEINTRISSWVNEEAQQRIHKTTGVKPYDRWLEEKPFLKFPNNSPSYFASGVRDHRTTQYGIMNHRGVTYHLGQAYAHTKVMVREVQEYGLPYIEIYHENKLISTIQIPTKRHSWVTVFEEISESITAKPNKRPAYSQKESNTHGVVVSERDLSYYKLSDVATKGVLYG